MTTNRRILFAQCMLALSLCLFLQKNAIASATKVGNGDDGSDLESPSPIRSGPIWESRLHAVEVLKRLNIMGIPGLGLLIPELERTDLFMASQDVHPTTEQAWAIEISEDQKYVYARTFAEPYAATRFFPEALKLTNAQLIALHIHEALHRALPVDVRTNENIVTNLTLAITSPGASFDRVRQMTSQYIRTPDIIEPSSQSLPTRASTLNAKLTLPPQSRTEAGYEFDLYTHDRYNLSTGGYLHGLKFATSLNGFKAIGPLAIEPIFHTRVKFSDLRQSTSLIGPASFELQGRIQTKEQSYVAPFARFTARSLDSYFFPADSDRDVITVGVLYQTESKNSYFDSALSYSAPSTSEYSNNSIQYGSIVSLNSRTGVRWRQLNMGVVAALHSSSGREEFDDESGSSRSGPFRILAVGPELGYTGSRIRFKLHGKWILNETVAQLDDLGDIVDRGAGQGGFGTSLSMMF